MDLDAELDSLVSSISTMGSKKPAAAAQKIQPAKNDNFDWPEEQPVSFTVDDMDSLLAEFEEAGPAKRRTAAKKPQIKRKGKYAEVSGAMQGNQLDSLLEDLDSQVASMDKTAGAKGKCEFCRQPILADIVTVNNRTFHPEHIFCAGCKKRDPNRRYFETAGGEVLCPACHGAKTGFVCAGCNEPILDRVVTAMGKKWHPQHFSCAGCGDNFANGTGTYMEGQDGKPYCAKCFKGSGVVCKACKKPVVSNNAVAALDGVFHKECFGCQACKKPFGPGFYNFEGLPYCEKHYLEKMGIPICGGCNQPITQGQFLTALNKKWHPEHFVCTFCMSPLKPDFKTIGDKPYCPGCHSSLA